MYVIKAQDNLWAVGVFCLLNWAEAKW
jgi:hypothetical protein